MPPDAVLLLSGNTPPIYPCQSQINLFNFKLFTRPESLACYHCGERVAVKSVVKMQFDGAQRDLCCHGCEAVLMLVDANGLTSDYVAEKSSTLEFSK